MLSYHSGWFLVFLLLAFSSAGAGVEAQTAVEDERATVCQAAKDAFYKTDLEKAQDPCQECEYDLETQKLSVTCTYEYCRECDTELGFCGFRYVEIETTLTNETLSNLLASPSNFTLGESKNWCLRYDDGDMRGRSTCIEVEETFNSNCEERFEDLPYGLPLLSCDSTVGCQCKVENSGIERTDVFIGYERLAFETCYEQGATATTELSSGPVYWIPAVTATSMLVALFFMQ